MKKLLSILLALTITLSFSVTFSAKSNNETESAYAENNSQTFTDIEAVRKKINSIYENNFNYFKSIAATLKPSISNEDYFTYNENCGPCSTAFQKVLYENGITVEIQRSTITKDHVFNFLRTSYTSSPNVETDIVIDTTYKQFIKGAYTKVGYTLDDMAYDLPDILIYEYGNYEQLCEQLSGLNKRFDQEKVTSLCKDLYGQTQYYFEYLPNDLQYLNSYNDAIEFSSQFIEDLRNTTAKFSVKLDNAPILNSTTSDLQKEFIYDANGVYRCYLEQSEIAEFSKGFTINNHNNEPLFGANKSCEVLGAVANSTLTLNYLCQLNRNSDEPVTINTNNLFGNAVLSIDLGSGIDTPTVYIIPISRTFYYGDVNIDGTVDISDVTYLQECIVGDEGKQLNNIQKSIADVTKTESLNINNATAISLKIAESQDFKHGEKLYFSCSLYLGFSDGSYSDNGYIDF